MIRKIKEKDTGGDRYAPNVIISRMDTLEKEPQEMEQPAGEYIEGSPDVSENLSDDHEPDASTQKPAADTVSFKRSHLYAVLLPLAFVMGLSVGFLFWGRSAPAAQQVAAAPASNASQPDSSGDTAPSEPLPSNVRRYDVPVDDDYVLGPEDPQAAQRHVGGASVFPPGQALFHA